MDDWIMFIGDVFTRDDPMKMKVIENPKFIPRIGEKVMMGYFPAATVETVGYDIEKKQIIVVCK